GARRRGLGAGARAAAGPRGRRARGDRARVPGRHGDPPSPRGAGVTQAPVQTPRLFRATDPRTGAFVGPEFAVTTPEELDGAVAAAVRAFPRFAAFPPEAKIGRAHV